MSYKNFCRTEFIYHVKDALKRNGLGTLTDVTEEIRKTNPGLAERVFTISTAHRSCPILILSSIDISDNETRDLGEDRVRVYLQWSTKYGVKNQYLHRFNRVDSFFGNLEKLLVDVSRRMKSVVARETDIISEFGDFKSPLSLIVKK